MTLITSFNISSIFSYIRKIFLVSSKSKDRWIYFRTIWQQCSGFFEVGYYMLDEERLCSQGLSHKRQEFQRLQQFSNNRRSAEDFINRVRKTCKTNIFRLIIYSYKLHFGVQWKYILQEIILNISFLTFRHRASCILRQAFHYSPENAFYIFNQQI